MKCCRGDRALYGIHPCEFSRSVSVPHDGAEAPFGSAALISAHSAAELMGEILNRMGLPYAQPSSGLQDTPGWRPLPFSVGFSSHTTFGVRQRQRSCRCPLELQYIARRCISSTAVTPGRPNGATVSPGSRWPCSRKCRSKKYAVTIASPVYLRPSGLIRRSLSWQWRSTTASSLRPTPLPCAGTYSLLQWLAKKRNVPETALQSLRNESAAFVPSSELVLHLSCSVRLRAESRNQLRNGRPT